jgi:hypothetical protein
MVCERVSVIVIIVLCVEIFTKSRFGIILEKDPKINLSGDRLQAARLARQPNQLYV